MELHFKQMIFAFLLIVIACGNHNNDHIEPIEVVLEKWYGQEIVLPDSLFCFTNSIMTPVLISDSDNFRLISLISADCPNCIEDIFNLYQFYSKIGQHDNAEVMIILFARDYDYLLSHYWNQLPQDLNIYIDPEYRFYDLNNYPKNELYRTFLINRGNEVIIIGDPIYNFDLQDLYLEKIRKK